MLKITIHNKYIVIFTFLGSVILGSFGFVVGLWSEKFDNMASATNFVIIPLSFLSGTFYSVDRLPDILKDVSEMNPFFYIIDGFRYGFVGVSDGDLLYGAIFLTALNIILIIINHYLFKSGWRLKT